MKVHGKKDNMKYTCDVCDKKLCSSYLLAKHKSEHAEENADDAKTVGESSDGMVEEGDEIKECNKAENGLYECNFCKKLLSTSLGLRIHLRRHTGKNLARCEVSNV